MTLKKPVARTLRMTKATLQASRLSKPLKKTPNAGESPKHHVVFNSPAAMPHSAVALSTTKVNISHSAPAVPSPPLVPKDSSLGEVILGKRKKSCLKPTSYGLQPKRTTAPRAVHFDGVPEEPSCGVAESGGDSTDLSDISDLDISDAGDVSDLSDFD
jgi:hypothetical protein